LVWRLEGTYFENVPVMWCAPRVENTLSRNPNTTVKPAVPTQETTCVISTRLRFLHLLPRRGLHIPTHLYPALPEEGASE
jgi:hypothetical protein